MSPRRWWHAQAPPCAARGKAEGEARGKAEVLLKLLRFKGFAVSPELAARVESCRDLGALDLWVERVLSATTLDDVFPGAAR